MRKSTSTLLFILVLIQCHSQTDKYSQGQQNDTIIWSQSYRLTYNDFKQKPVINSKFKAISYLCYPYRCKIRNDTTYLNIFCFFLKTKSWFNKDSLTTAHDVILLSHEQGHFDIAEIETRKLRKKFIEAHLNKTNSANIVQELSKEMLISVKNIDDIYDKETDFSVNKTKQKEWELKIRKQLQELSAYSSPIIKIPWKK